jgi:hypothetical protein
MLTASVWLMTIQFLHFIKNCVEVRVRLQDRVGPVCKERSFEQSGFNASIPKLSITVCLAFEVSGGCLERFSV